MSEELEPGDYFEQWCEDCEGETEHQVSYEDPKVARCVECNADNKMSR
jgi:hypothetical protein